MSSKSIGIIFLIVFVDFLSVTHSVVVFTVFKPRIGKNLELVEDLDDSIFNNAVFFN